MITPGRDGTTLHPAQVPVQTKLAAAWTSFMFFYVYVDLLGLYKPGVVEDILKGKVFTFDISQTFAVTALALTAVPVLMILLSTALPIRANRVTNLVVAILLVPYMAFNVFGGEWLVYYGLGLALEMVILGFILRTAWTWSATTRAASVNSYSQLQHS